MADQENCKDVKLLKRTRISVFVDEALPDILVVTYEFGVQIFKGVLLESTKRNLPCGVPNLNPALNIPSKNPDDDALYAVNQRFAYTDPASAAAAKKKNVQITSKLKNNKMTVRLRPRQVLCSKCKGICNENSENVSKKRKDPDSTSAPPSQSPAKRPPASRASYLSLSNKRRAQTHEPTLVPKLTRLTLQECKDFNVDNSLLKKPLASINNHENHSSDCSSSSEEVTDSRSARKKMLRKKRSISEETSEENKDVDTILHCSSTNTRTIKISYGPQGEGTVLKIPAKLELDDSEENVEEPDANKDTTTPHDKAARKALKKAKKEAKRKVLLSSTTPSVYPGSNSPGYTIGVSSPRYTVGSASPRHGLGSNSPRYANFEINMPKKRKHKMKHKRKHRDEKDKKYKESEVSSTQDDDSRDLCGTQKLSINLKRLNNTYTSCSQVEAIIGEEENEDNSSSDEMDSAPEFPQSNPPITLRINANALSNAMGADGVRLLVGDVVWGKMHGFPWWPCKILTITSGSDQIPKAHVSWYGYNTSSSLLECDQLSPYLDNFKIRYNKKKRGPYKEAIKQASLEAKENAENRVRQPLGNSPSPNIIPQVVPPALASPREIDVVS